MPELDRVQPGSHSLIFRNYTYSIFNFDGFANDIMFLFFVYSFGFFAGWSDSWGTAITTKSRTA